MSVPFEASHTFTVRSRDAEYIQPEPPHLTHVTHPLWPVRAMSVCPLIASHIRIVKSFEADASRVRPGSLAWYGSHAMLVIHFVCPFRGPPRGLPFAGSHNRTVLSILPVASMPSSGDHATASTHPVWPFRVCCGVPVSQSNILAVLSPLPVASFDDVAGENAVARIDAPCPLMLAEHLVTGLTLNTASARHGMSNCNSFCTDVTDTI